MLRRLSERRGELHDLGARRLRLFGSFARGEGRAESAALESAPAVSGKPLDQFTVPAPRN